MSLRSLTLLNLAVILLGSGAVFLWIDKSKTSHFDAAIKLTDLAQERATAADRALSAAKEVIAEQDKKIKLLEKMLKGTNDLLAAARREVRENLPEEMGQEGETPTSNADDPVTGLSAESTGRISWLLDTFDRQYRIEFDMLRASGITGMDALDRLADSPFGRKARASAISNALLAECGGDEAKLADVLSRVKDHCESHWRKFYAGKVPAPGVVPRELPFVIYDFLLRETQR